jgi:hypothetical protein
MYVGEMFGLSPSEEMSFSVSKGECYSVSFQITNKLGTDSQERFKVFLGVSFEDSIVAYDSAASSVFRIQSGKYCVKSDMLYLRIYLPGPKSGDKYRNIGISDVQLKKEYSGKIMSPLIF